MNAHDINASGRLPDFLIIGAPRAGTTALARYLDDHPQVFMSATKELQFFDRAAYSPDRIPWYMSQFAAARQGQVAGEASPLYLFAPDAASRMAAVVPNAKLVALLRDPIDRAWSHYWFRRMWRVENRSFEQATTDELAGRAPKGAEYLAIGDYAEQLDRLERWFPPAAIHVVLFDDLIADPVGVFAGACRHIHVDDTQVPEVVGTRINTTYDVRSVGLWRMTERYRGKPSAIGRVTSLVDRWNVSEFRPPALDPHVRRRLAERFEGSNRKLADRLGRDLRAWSD